VAEVEFFFDPGCPWSWLTSERLQEAVMRTGATIRWRPLLATSIAGAASDPPAESPAGRYRRQDLTDWAQFCGVTVRRPDPLPAPLAAAAIAATAALGGPVPRVVAACFAAGPGGSTDLADLADHKAVLQLVAAAGGDARRLAAQLDDPRWAAEVQHNAHDLVARGGFRAATMFVAGRMYCGHTRVPLVELALMRGAEHPLIVPGAHGQT
jgi:2-hydroxychromene-2-carboxylate isomerase